MIEWCNTLISQTIDLIGQGHWAALSTLFLIVVLTEIGVPFPFVMDSVLLLTSYQHGLSFQAAYTFTVIFAGRQCGAGTVYWLARWLGNRLTRVLYRRFPKSEPKLSALMLKLNKGGVFAIALPRISGLLHLSSIAAGTINFPYRSFILGVALSSIMFDGALVLLGFLTAHGVRIFGVNPPHWMIVAGLIVLMVLVWIIRYTASLLKKHRAR
jgi:membrane protein DedA with SNARE-associated domain